MYYLPVSSFQVGFDQLLISYFLPFPCHYFFTGILPLVFENPADYDKIQPDDKVSLLGLKELAPGKVFSTVVPFADFLPFCHSMISCHPI